MAKDKSAYWTSPEGLIKLEVWARNGLKDQDIAKNMGISRSTLNVWKNKHSDISDTLKKGKEVVDAQVENALLKRALGYSYNEDKYISVPMEQEEYDIKLTQYMNMYKYEHPEAADSELMIAKEQFPKTKMQLVERKQKEVVPDTTAQIFWLKNRMPDKWRDKQNVEISGALETEETKLDDLIRQMRGG